MRDGVDSVVRLSKETYPLGRVSEIYAKPDLVMANAVMSPPCPVHLQVIDHKCIPQ